ncbi:MAG: helix-turn-helix domain-containing protein [Ktedonobacteraceae bacterium]
MEKGRKPRKANNLLRREREKRGWSQNRLAELIDADTSMISRWECGERNPDNVYQEKLCTLFEKNAEELGFIPPYIPPDEDSPLITANTPIISRREASKEIGSIIGSTFLAPRIILEDTDVLNRLLRVVRKPSSIDTTALTLLETMTRNHWQLYAHFENSIQYRHNMLTSVTGHLQSITHMMEHPQPERIQTMLSSLAGETTQLIGEIFFDLKDNVSAERYYNASIELARETGNTVSLATALGRKSFIPIYSNNPQKALPFLKEAHTRLTDHTSDIIHAWLFAREAEVYAKIDDANACMKALEKAEYYLERAQPEEVLSYAFAGEAVEVHFTHSLLQGYKGACYTYLKQPAAAQTALKEEIALLDPSRSIHNAIVLIDLAKTYIQQEEIEEACRHATEALQIMVQLQSTRVFQRLLDLRRELEGWNNTEHVKNLDQQMAMLPHIM